MECDGNDEPGGRWHQNVVTMRTGHDEQREDGTDYASAKNGPHAPAPWPAASDLVSHEPVWQRPVCGAPRTERQQLLGGGRVVGFNLGEEACLRGPPFTGAPNDWSCPHGARARHEWLPLPKEP